MVRTNPTNKRPTGTTQNQPRSPNNDIVSRTGQSPLTVQYVDPKSHNARQLPAGFVEEDFVSGTTSNRRGAGGRASIAKYATAFMASMDRKYAETTKVALKRRYRRIDSDMEHLYKEGKISTLSPKNMTSGDIHNFFAYRTNLGVSNSEMIHEIAALSNLFRFIKSDAVEDCLNEYPYLKPQTVYERGESIDSTVCEMIYDNAMRVDPSEWKDMISYAVVVFALATGMRSKELRKCNIQDINASGPEWVAMVKHPKGEGKWGKIRRVAIDPAAYPFMERYFYARADYVQKHNVLHTALFPGGMCDNGELQGNTIRSYVEYVSQSIGVDFDLRTCRRTYGQNLIDRGADIETVSKMLGHNSTLTTEKCYCSLEQDNALAKASEVFSTKKSVPYGGITMDTPQMPFGFDTKATSPRSSAVNGGTS